MLSSVQQRRGALTFAFTLFVVPACNRSAQNTPPPSGIPPLVQGSSAAQANTNPPAGQTTTAAAQAAEKPSLPPGHPPLGTAPVQQFEGKMPGGPFDPKATLQGRISLSPKLKDKVGPGETIYLTVRQDDGSERGGTILAVKRLTVSTWPHDFELDGRDAMFEGTQFTGKVIVWAHIDKDGDPLTRSPGDLLGELHTTIPSHLGLSIDRVIE